MAHLSPRRASTTAALALLAALTLAAGAAQAAKPKDPKARATAQAAVGRKLIEQGDFAGALRELQAAQAIFPDGLVDFDIGVAYQGLGKDAEASDSFRTFIVRADNPPADKVARAQRAISEIDAKQAGGLPKLTAAPGAPAAAAPASPYRRWWMAGAGVTVALGVATTVAGLRARSRYQDLDGGCGKTAAGCSPATIDDERGRIRLTNILLGATALAAAATGVLVVLDVRGDTKGVAVAWRF